MNPSFCELPFEAGKTVNQFYRTQRQKSRVQRGERSCVVYRNQDMIAALRLRPVPHGDARLTARCWWMRSVFVCPEERGKGIGLALIQFATALLAGQSCYCFPLPHLGELYRGAGFTVCGVEDLPTELGSRFARYRQQQPGLLAMVYTSEPGTAAA